MDHPKRAAHPSASRDCPKTRLAESGIGAVDICDCGMWQLHIGALTVRLAPAAASELLGLLGQAVAEDSARRLGEVERSLDLPLFGKGGSA